MYQKFICVGNVVKTPELRYTGQGTPVCNMTVAINSKVKSGDEYKDEVLFMDCVVWGKQGESCSQYLDKGRQVLVEGRLQTRSWEKDGQKHYKTECVAVTVKFLGKKDDTQSQDSGSEPF